MRFSCCNRKRAATSISAVVGIGVAGFYLALLITISSDWIRLNSHYNAHEGPLLARRERCQHALNRAEELPLMPCAPFNDQDCRRQAMAPFLSIPAFNNASDEVLRGLIATAARAVEEAKVGTKECVRMAGLYTRCRAEYQLFLDRIEENKDCIRATANYTESAWNSAVADVNPSLPLNSVWTISLFTITTFVFLDLSVYTLYVHCTPQKTINPVAGLSYGPSVALAQ